MQREDVGKILERLGGHYAKEIEPAQAYAWYEALRSLPVEAGEEALETIVKSDKWMPNATEFQQVTQMIVREQRRQEGGGRCTHCDHGWTESRSDPGNVLPCEACCPDVFDMWRTKWQPEIARRRADVVNENTLFDTNPREEVERIREHIKDVATPDGMF